MKSFILVVSLFVAALSIYVTQVAAKTPIKCTKSNEEFANCGDVCPVYCDTHLPHPCPKICKIGGGCVCMKGYVRKSKNNPRCILRKHCPKKGK